MDSKAMTRKMLIGGIAAFVFVFLYEMLVHGFLMMPLYSQVADLWRPEEEANMLVMSLSQMLFAFAVAFFYPVVGMDDEKCKKTIPFAFGLGLVMAMPQIGTYGWLPIPFSISLAWAAVSFAKAFGTAFIVGKIFNR